MFDTWLWAPASNLLMVALTAIGIYTAVIIGTRLAGLRSFSKMSAFDFAVTVALGTVVGTTLLSKDPPLIQGVVGLATLFLLQKLISLARQNSRISRLVDNKPMLLMRRGRILHENMRRANVSENDLRAKLREANITRREQVDAVVLEITGEMSGMHGDPGDILGEWLLDEVSDPETGDPAQVRLRRPLRPASASYTAHCASSELSATT